MKIKLSKKTRTFLWVVTALTTSTAVTTVLTSCSVGNQNIINDIGGWDATYGINDATYKRMEEDFEILYKSQLDKKLDKGDITDDIYSSSLCTFKNNLNFFHASLYSGENKTLSYTIKTNVLRDYAKNNYGIRLTRQSNVSLNDTISNIKSSVLNSVLLLCKENKIPDAKIEEYRENAQTKFNELYEEAKAKYGDDVVSIVQHIQSGMVSCFANINKELDVLITQQQLKDFISKYQISVREDIAESYYWDKLSLIYSEPNQEISAEDFNNIFEITYEDSDPQSSNGSYFSSSKKTVKFENDMITGYTLKPILAKMNGDPYTNVYSIDVDYTLVNINYKDDEKVAELTAHSSQLKDKSFYEDENISIFDLNKSSEEREYTNYILPITKEYEEQQINKTYFNNQDFKFTWSTSEEYGYDDFWTESNEKGEYKSKLNVSGLATSGMMINGVLLIDILNQAEKISLSGGSVSLSGKAKTKGEDSKQWKLTIDNEGVDKDAIQWKLISPTNEKLPDTISINDGIVSWTDQIETGAYNFYVLAICKETKIQTPLITLTISSEQLGNVESFDHNVKNSLYDESTIDQKLIDFVNNVYFSLDYTENDYGTDKDGKKGEINVDDFTIGYKNSKNTFKTSNAINEAISSAINNDSGITIRYSNSLYKNMKASYDSVVKLTSINDIVDAFSSASSTTKDLLTSFVVLDSISAALYTCVIISAFMTLSIDWKKADTKFKKIKKIISLIISIGVWIAGFWFIYSDASGIADTLDDAEKFYKFVNGENSKLLNHINTDKNKFSNKDNFNSISIIEQRQLKSYYEKYYENDLEEFYGGKANLEKVKQDYDEDLDYKIGSFVKKIPFLIGFPALITFLLWDSVIKGFNTVKNAATKVKYSLVSGWNKITQCIHH